MNQVKLVLIAVSLLVGHMTFTRSVFREKETWLPSLSVKLENSSKTYTIRNAHLDEYPFFNIFDPTFFNAHQLPSDLNITYRYDATKKVSAHILQNQIEQLITEIQRKQKKYSHFTIIQKKDFNRRKGVGLLVLKFKQYPFILKLFLETPDSFVNYQCKGIEPIFFFYMGGGVNRHLSGFTRIKNLEYVNKKVAQDTYWSMHATTPRKWFWQPRNIPWFEICGKNMGDGREKYIKIPSVYGIIADEIYAERHFAYHKSKDRQDALKFCNFLGLYVDPNIRNFMIEQTTGKIAIVDTEHFPTIVGLEQAEPIANYLRWFALLMGKCAKNMLFSTKKEHKEIHRTILALR